MPQHSPEKDVLLLFVLVHGEELLLLGVEQPDDVTALQDVLLVLFVLQKQGDLPGRLRVDHVHLKKASNLLHLNGY